MHLNHISAHYFASFHMIYELLPILHDILAIFDDVAQNNGSIHHPKSQAINASSCWIDRWTNGV